MTALTWIGLGVGVGLIVVGLALALRPPGVRPLTGSDEAALAARPAQRPTPPRASDGAGGGSTPNAVPESAPAKHAPRAGVTLLPDDAADAAPEPPRAESPTPRVHHATIVAFDDEGEG